VAAPEGRRGLCPAVNRCATGVPRQATRRHLIILSYITNFSRFKVSICPPTEVSFTALMAHHGALCQPLLAELYDTIRYGTVKEFNVDSKAECDQLSLVHETRNMGQSPT